MSTLHDLLSLRKQRLAIQREADLLEQKEKELANLLIAQMLLKKTDVTVDGEDQAQLVSSQEPVVTNWPQYLDYIKSSGEVDLLEKRPMRSAVKARWAEGVILPGVESQTKYSLKFNV